MTACYSMTRGHVFQGNRTVERFFKHKDIAFASVLKGIENLCNETAASVLHVNFLNIITFFSGSHFPFHYSDVIMSAMAQTTSLRIVYSIIYSGADQRKHQSYTSLALVMGIHRWPINSPHKGPVTGKFLPFDDDILCTSSSTKYPCQFIDLRANVICFIFNRASNKQINVWSPALKMKNIVCKNIQEQKVHSYIQL